MKFLLINTNQFKQPWPVIPFGLCCIAASSEKAGHDVRVLDLCFSKSPETDIKKQIEDFSPQVVGLNIRNIDNGVGYNTLFLLEKIKNGIIHYCKKYFEGPILIGGPAVGVSGPEMLEYLDLEYAIQGDGEDAIVEFLGRLEKNKPLDGMAGLIWRKDSLIKEANEPMRVQDMDSLPQVVPTRYIDIKPYMKFNSPIQIQTKRGCALNCSYCTYNRIEGLAYRLKNPNRVADEIENLVRETGIKSIEFTDSTFNVPLSHSKKVLKSLINKKLNLNLRTMGLNPGQVDEELVQLMKEAGFKDVDLGAEAGCNAMLKSLGKNFTKTDVLNAGRLLQKKKIPVTWYLLLGAPGETPETVKETLETIHEAASDWDLVNAAVGLRVYKGAPIAHQMKEENPTMHKDNFLLPTRLPESTTLPLGELKHLTKMESFRRANLFMYDEDEKTPEFLLKLGTWLIKTFSPSQPIWRLFIVIRKVQTALGIRWIQKQVYLWKAKK